MLDTSRSFGSILPLKSADKQSQVSHVKVSDKQLIYSPRRSHANTGLKGGVINDKLKGRGVVRNYVLKRFSGDYLKDQNNRKITVAATVSIFNYK